MLVYNHCLLRDNVYIIICYITLLSINILYFVWIMKRQVYNYLVTITLGTCNGQDNLCPRRERYTLHKGLLVN